MAGDFIYTWIPGLAALWPDFKKKKKEKDMIKKTCAKKIHQHLKGLPGIRKNDEQCQQDMPSTRLPDLWHRNAKDQRATPQNLLGGTNKAHAGLRSVARSNKGYSSTYTTG